MKRTLLFCILAACGAGAPIDENAIPVLPVLQPQLFGNTLAVDLMIQHLGTPVPVSTYEFTLDYDSALLSEPVVQYYPFLGEPDVGTANATITQAPGSVKIEFASLLNLDQLTEAQAGLGEIVPLATIVFASVLGEGEVPPNVPIEETFGLGGGVSGCSCEICIPEPSSMSLVVLAGSLLLAHRLRKWHFT